MVAVTKVKPGPGRPRGFDLEAALDAGQGLFHAHGYDGVGLAALTDRLGIAPPSFYKAFGSKAAFFGRILERYATTALPLGAILLPGRAPDEALAELLIAAARTYGHDPQRRGCLVLEAVRGGEGDGTRLALPVAANRREQVRAFVAATHPDAADAVTDYVASTMSGLSASAREGMDEARLVAVASASLAGIGLLLNGADRPADVGSGVCSSRNR